MPIRTKQPDADPRDSYEHPAFGDLYARVLRDVADRGLEPETRKAAARAIAFLLREQLVTERVATDVLTAMHRSLDLPKVVRTLLLGLVGVSAPEKIAVWTRAVADRALREGHLPSFISAMRVLVELPGYDGRVPTRWRLSILRAAENRELPRRVLLFAREYARRFPAESWRWIRLARIRSTIAILRRHVPATAFEEARDS